MCGIAGIVGDTSVETLLPAAHSMAAAMRHRGPDSCAVISSPGCLLVNTRLAILDLSERGRQPMSNSGRTVWITYNGETYNASELRRDLVEKGFSFKSTTDTEVVLHLYEHYGDHCVDKMRGMFAFAIWDTRERKLLLARDRLGIKPLYFVRQNGKFIFASELECLLASGLIDRRVNPQALSLYLQLGHIPPPWTMIDSVAPLPPGHMASWQDGLWDVRSYWSFDAARQSRKPVTDVVDELSDLLLEAVRAHLVSDLPIALFLSGGTDSACLGALAHGAGAENVTAMSIGFSDPEFDETQLSRRTARSLALAFKSVLLPPDRVASGVDSCIDAMDEPTVDGLNSFWISKITAEEGFKVALSGQGGDELFGGYTSRNWFKRFERMAACTGRFPSELSRLFDREQWPYRWRKLSYVVGDRDPFLASQMTVKVLFLESDLARLLTPAVAESSPSAETRDYLRNCASGFRGRDRREMLTLMDICTHLQPRLLRDLDAMSMAHSLEVRPPFLDDRIVEFVLNLHGSVLARPKELLLRSMKRFMPAELVADLKSRAKRTFTLPFATWLARDLKPLLAETFSPGRLTEGGILEPAAVGRVWERFQKFPEAVGWTRIWSLFVLARWCEAKNVHL
jgi:asparagine synthase (glutamine-hydrolysing)